MISVWLSCPAGSSVYTNCLHNFHRCDGLIGVRILKFRLLSLSHSEPLNLSGVAGDSYIGIAIFVHDINWYATIAYLHCYTTLSIFANSHKCLRNPQQISRDEHSSHFPGLFVAKRNSSIRDYWSLNFATGIISTHHYCLSKSLLLVVQITVH